MEESKKESNLHKISIAVFGLAAILLVSSLYAGESSLGTGLSLAAVSMLLGETPFWKSQSDGIYVVSIFACGVFILWLIHKPLIDFIENKLLELEKNGNQ